MKSVPFKKQPFAFTTILIAASCVITFLVTSYVYKEENHKIIELAETATACKYEVKRLEGYTYVKPLLFIDDYCEGDSLVTIKKEMNDIIERYKYEHGVVSASVYLRDYHNNSWTSVNEEVAYEPGSLFKVPILMAYLKMSEQKPGTLDKELLFETPFAINKNVAFHSKQIQLGKSYKIRELLKYMIAYSDNNATALLNNNLKPEVLKKLFTDFKLEVPDTTAQHYYFTVTQYSLFMRALYNASYLTIDNSEFAMELLNKCDFNKGIVNGLPKGTRVTHKFGESGTPVEMQLHESAIIYGRARPYLLTVMTKGKDNASLCNLLSDLSDSVYKNINKQ
jgi:beta-lactamase class A